MPKRIQRKRTKGYRMPEGAIYVGRPTKWGNPFIGADAVKKYRWALTVAETGADSIDKYDAWCNAGGRPEIWGALRENWSVLDELRGNDLACWCPLVNEDGTAHLCHADILLKIVNGKTEGKV